MRSTRPARSSAGSPDCRAHVRCGPRHPPALPRAASLKAKRKGAGPSRRTCESASAPPSPRSTTRTPGSARAGRSAGRGSPPAARRTGDRSALARRPFPEGLGSNASAVVRLPTWKARMAGGRMRRVDEAVRAVLSDAITTDLKDPRVGFVTVTAVDTSPDLRHARVYVSVLGAEDERRGLARGPAVRPRLPAASRRERAAPQAHATLELRLRRQVDRGMRSPT